METSKPKLEKESVLYHFSQSMNKYSSTHHQQPIPKIDKTNPISKPHNLTSLVILF